MIELARRFLHLLPQKMKDSETLFARVVRIDFHVITDCLRRPERKDTASGQQSLGANPFEQFLCIIKQLPRLLADNRIVKDRRITSSQFPRMEEGRPIYIRD